MTGEMPPVDEASTVAVVDAALSFAALHPEAASHITALVAHLGAWRGCASRLMAERVPPEKRAT